MNEERSGKHHWVPVVAAIITASAVVIAAYVGADAKRQVETLKIQNETLEKELTSVRGKLQACKPEGLVDRPQQPPDSVPSTAAANVRKTLASKAESTNPTRVIDDIAITITRVHLSDDVIAFDFQVVNNAPGDKQMNLFGEGSFGNGGSRLTADAQEYAATSIKVGNEMRDGIVGKRFVSGVPLNGHVAFKGVPRTLQSIAVLELAYSYNNLRPAGVFRFSNLTVN